MALTAARLLDFFHFLFEDGIERLKAFLPLLAQAPDPRFQFAHGLRIDLIDPLLGALFHLDHSGLSQNLEVLRDGGRTGLKFAGNIGGR